MPLAPLSNAASTEPTFDFAPRQTLTRLTPSTAFGAVRIVGRYAVHAALASGGMGTVHLGRVLGDGGFERVVAIKRMHSSLSTDENLVAAFHDEARLAARIRHPNVVAPLDVVTDRGDCFLVLDYVPGASLSQVLRQLRLNGRHMPVAIACSIVAGVLHGLHAAHEATDEYGYPLHIVHRDVSPQNILVGADGTARILDFGIAKADRRGQQTMPGLVKGKRGYLAPEQRHALPIDARADVYSAGIVLWEALTGRPLFAAGGDQSVSAPSEHASHVPPVLDGVVARALNTVAADRYASAKEFAIALEVAVPVAPEWQVAEWLQGVVANLLSERAARVAAVERAGRIFPNVVARAEVVTRGELRPFVIETASELTEGPLEVAGLLPARRLGARAVVASVLVAAFVLCIAALVTTKTPTPTNEPPADQRLAHWSRVVPS